MTVADEQRWGSLATDVTTTEIWCRPDKASVRLHLAGAIDLASRETVLAAGITACLVSSVLQIDAGSVQFIDAAGLGALIEVTEFARQEGVTVRLSSCSSALRRVLELTDTQGAFAAPTGVLDPC